MEPKICPILGAGPLEINSNCKGNRCAWYIRGRCAVAVLADSADSCADQLENIALGDLLDGIQK